MDEARATALDRAADHFDNGGLFDDLARRVGVATESQNPDRGPELAAYLDDEMVPAFEALGFGCEAHLDSDGNRFLIADRTEDPGAATVLGYGHGDVIRGQADRWKPGTSPWELTDHGGTWYGRGVADNKGQHSVNIAALGAVLAERGRLGFNAKFLIEMGEEVGSPGLHRFCREHRHALAADVLIASDGPRLSADRPTVFLGARGALNFGLQVNARDGAHHSGNWGGLLSNPAIRLAQALATITTPTGQILIDDWLPDSMPEAVRTALADCQPEQGPGSPEIDPTWGEPDLTPAEQVYGWCSFEVLAMGSGDPARPVNAIPATAQAHCQIRFVVGPDPERFLPALREHLCAAGFDDVQVISSETPLFVATRTDPDHPWVRKVVDSIGATTNKTVAVLPNLGGSLPNDVFTDIVDLPTVWVPHSYPGCSQHAPDEHLPAAVLREALLVMTGLYWDLGT